MLALRCSTACSAAVSAVATRQYSHQVRGSDRRAIGNVSISGILFSSSLRANCTALFPRKFPSVGQPKHAFYSTLVPTSFSSLSLPSSVAFSSTSLIPAHVRSSAFHRVCVFHVSHRCFGSKFRFPSPPDLSGNGKKRSHISDISEYEKELEAEEKPEDMPSAYERQKRQMLEEKREYELYRKWIDPESGAENPDDAKIDEIEGHLQRIQEQLDTGRPGAKSTQKAKEDEAEDFPADEEDDEENMQQEEDDEEQNDEDERNEDEGEESEDDEEDDEEYDDEEEDEDSDESDEDDDENDDEYNEDEDEEYDEEDDKFLEEGDEIEDVEQDKTKNSQGNGRRNDKGQKVAKAKSVSHSVIEADAEEVTPTSAITASRAPEVPRRSSQIKSKSPAAVLAAQYAHVATESARTHKKTVAASASKEPRVYIPKDAKKPDRVGSMVEISGEEYAQIMQDRYNAMKFAEEQALRRKVQAKNSFKNMKAKRKAYHTAIGTENESSAKSSYLDAKKEHELRIEAEMKLARFSSNDPVAHSVGGFYYTKDHFFVQESDLRESFIRGSGPGGQAINKLSNCVDLCHTPTGTRVKCQKTRDLQENRRIARKILEKRLEELVLGDKSRQALKRLRTKRKKEKKLKRAAKIHAGAAQKLKEKTQKKKEMNMQLIQTDNTHKQAVIE